MKSDALRRTRRSAAEVHLRVEPKFTHAASLGELQLSLGNTAPSNDAITPFTLSSNSGNAGDSNSSSGSSSFDHDS